jgi:hypothetical protein
MYNYFAHNLKQHIELCKLVEFLETKGNIILNNMKTYWIFILSLAKRVLIEYRILVVKMATKNATIDNTKINYELLCDVKTLLGLACVLPLLEVMPRLFKFAHRCDTFICDFVSTIKLCEVELFIMCYDTKNIYS